jgi:hypothetical protein
MDRKGTSTENAQKGDSLGDSLGPHWDLALSAKVTSGGLSTLSPDGRWGATSNGLRIPGSPVQAPLLNIKVEEPQVTIIVEKQ